MKIEYIKYLLLISIMCTATSCNTIKGIFGKSSSKEVKQANKIESVEKLQSKNVSAKMEQVAVLASGTDHALNKITNKEPPIKVASDINKRVISLSGKPDLNAEKEIWKTVDQLTSQLESEKIKGAKSLEKKDVEITALQNEAKMLLDSKDIEISKYMKLASDTAMLADARKVELDSYQGWFGLKAVFKGAWQFVKTVSWFLLGSSILFLILRFASMTNPAAASVFRIFEHIISWVINAVSYLFPKAISIAGHVSKEMYDTSQTLLKKIIDNVQTLKNLQNKVGHDITLKELFVELDKAMDSKEKEIVDKLKKDLGY